MLSGLQIASSRGRKFGREFGTLSKPLANILSRFRGLKIFQQELEIF